MLDGAKLKTKLKTKFKAQVKQTKLNKQKIHRFNEAYVQN